MGPADHVNNPKGPFDSCSGRHFGAPQARTLMSSQAGASSASDLHGDLRRKPRPYVSRTSCSNPSGSSSNCMCRLSSAPYG
eukprot:603163-Pyramimonas_sp.AAC.1